jgi:hypothetical protein
MEKNKNGVLREVKRTAIGLAVAFGIVGLAAVAVFYFFPGLYDSSGRGWSSVEEGSVEIYYKREGLSDLDPESYLSRVRKAKEEIVGRLKIEESKVPDRIRIYLHEDLNALRSAIAERKSSSEINVPLAVIDIIDGFEIKPILVRLLTYFSWGRPSSEFLRMGLQNYFSDRVDDPHLRVAALGNDLFSFQEIESLSETDNIPLTLHDKIYDSFDSPYAPAGMDLSSFSYLLRSETGRSPYSYKLEAEATSLVSYLLERHGTNKLRSLWRSDNWLRRVKNIYGITPEELEGAWHEFLEKTSVGGFEYVFYRARTLYSRGKLAKALNMLDDKSEGKVEARQVSYLKARIYFYSGKWDKARSYFSDLENRELDRDTRAGVEAYLSMLEVYEGGTKRKVQGLTLFGSKSVAEIDRITSTCSRVVQRAESEIPAVVEELGNLRVFVSEEESVEGFRDQLSHPDGVVFGSESGNSSLKVATLIANEVSRTPTYSNLLRRGLVHFLTGSDAFQLAKKVLGGGRWESLSGITVDLDPKANSSVQAGAFVGFIILRYGPEKFIRVWHLTTPLGGDVSLETALTEVVGKGLREVEDDLVGFLKSYEG